MTMLCHNNFFLVRHRDASDVPFQVFSKETLKHDAEVQAFSCEEDLLKFTPTDTIFPENTSEGNRWCRASPMYSDGELIFFLVQYKTSGYSSSTVKTVLETYEVDEDARKLKRV